MKTKNAAKTGTTENNSLLELAGALTKREADELGLAKAEIRERFSKQPGRLRAMEGTKRM